MLANIFIEMVVNILTLQKTMVHVGDRSRGIKRIFMEVRALGTSREFRGSYGVRLHGYWQSFRH